MPNPETKSHIPDRMDEFGQLDLLREKAAQKVSALAELNTRFKGRLDGRIRQLLDFIEIAESTSHNQAELQQPVTTVKKLLKRAIDLGLM
jgi:hypothetical protein